MATCKEFDAAQRKVLASLDESSLDGLGSHGRVTLLWEDEILYAFEEHGPFGLNLALCGTSDKKARVLWIPPEVLPLLIEVAQRSLAEHQADQAKEAQ